MKLRDGQLSISPTDLSYFLSCRHRTALELSVAHGVRKRPVWNDPLLEALFAMGNQHEREYVAALGRASKSLVDLAEERDPGAAIARTIQAMHDGADVIVQAALARGRWYGRPDVLMKVNRPSPALGAWSYEAADTKLARETRGGTILQLGQYCELIEAAQGIAPVHFHVVTPANADTAAKVVRTYRLGDFAAYFRLMKNKLEEELERGHVDLAALNYPEPVDHCDVCPWIPECRDRRRADDHLSLVAGISRLQRRELEPHGIVTVEALAAVGHPIPFRPRGAIETYERVRDQARLQVQSRREGRIVHELIPPPPRSESAEGPPTNLEPIGLARLPEPSAGDLFLDLEGDPLAGDGGREYLFGLVAVAEDEAPSYRAWWANNAGEERRAFEALIDLITARLAAYPDLHVYHYAPYEPSALKRLMGRYATRGRELDQLLRGRRFIDLYAVIRQGVRAGVERYSIKNLEPLYDFTRAVDLRDANRALRLMEQAFELDRFEIATPEVRAVVEGYNRDDCVSTLRLRDWLELRRADLISSGASIDRPPLIPGGASEELDDRARAVEALRARLLAGVPDDPAERAPDQQARYQLAYLLDWHRREDKAGWWEYFRLRELPEEDLLEEPNAVAGLMYVADVERVHRSVVQRYAWPEQEMEIRRGATLKTQDGTTFTTDVAGIDRTARTIDLLVGPSKLDLKPTALFAHDHVGTRVIEDALFALGERVADTVNDVADIVKDVAAGLQPRGTSLPPCPELALLLRETPTLRSGPFAPPPRESGSAVTDYAAAIVTDLDRTTLAIQGPPGSGKTYTGARMIIRAVEAGLKVGVTATSHKVIRNLLDAVLSQCSSGPSGPETTLRIGRKAGDDDDAGEATTDAVMAFTDNDAPLAALESGDVNVLGGTAWLWARPEFSDSVDVLFVDEAGQMSLANVLGVARAASSVVLLGDPQQLEQPSKGSHPDGVGVSALQHILGDSETMPEGRGMFLPITWRLAPSICRFTSELFYAGALTSKPGLENQALTGNGRFDGAGLWLVPVEHQGNRNASDQEAAVVVDIVAGLLARGSMWIDEDGVEHQMTPGDIRIVAPFNAHVSRIREEFKLRSSNFELVPVGTVDKFQGQEAPVVIYSMATSHPEDAPRGMEFLYSLNRLNVATSRARCAAILVASPRLVEPDCRTPRQMRLANALCRFRELAATN